MKDTISDKICRWANNPADSTLYDSIDRHIEFKSKKSYNLYDPVPNGPDFFHRLTSWVNNVDDDDMQKELFKIVPEIYYLGINEFNSLYTAAYNEHILHWLISKNNIKFDNNINFYINDCVESTIFCSATDSFDIAKFHHRNHINGKKIRYNMRQLLKSGGIRNFVDELRSKSIKHIVVLEDFVGSGSQILNIDKTGGDNLGLIDFLNDISDDFSSLFCPLVICPKGKENITEAIGQNDNITLSSVLEMPDDMFVKSEAIIRDDESIYSKIYEIVCKVDPYVGSEYGPLGYRDTGSLIVMHTNCPDNTISLIHTENEMTGWKALFPRSSRI